MQLLLQIPTKAMNKETDRVRQKILSKTGDLNFKRRVITMLDYLDIQPGENILDMGCGEGFYSMVFDNLYDCKITAVDYDPEILSLAHKWLDGRKNVSLEQGDITKLRFPDNYFDKIVCTEVLEHIDDDVTAIKELYRVLKPGGIIAITVPNKNYPLLWDPLNKIREGLGLGHFSPMSGFWGGIWAKDHKRLYLPSELKSLAEGAGFLVEDLKALTHFGVPFNHLILWLGKTLYTKMPVSEDVKKSMEKFEWEEGETKRQTFSSFILNKGFSFLKAVDNLNNREFPLTKSTMAVALKGVKK
ncbi:MAG: Methyltransferase type 11 [candidate division WWE3 bacterium GW2011_GWE2_42_25]|nr:MAG: Methyltransferase type 11 [candidate division WWE3 bacterium GW2011_GWC2_41_23]KKS51380.1 MAG: Methyltransferase type 11 [candidate division WWE3 bacterium GW2011_GWE2_42_25]